MIYTTPRAFQIDGVLKIEEFSGRALLADSMGLGKTIQSLMWLDRNLPPDRSAVVVCPASLKWNWEAEAWKHWRVRAEVLSGSRPSRLPFRRLYVINYDVLGPWITELKRLDPFAVIYDECQALRNRSTNRTLACKRMAKGVPHLIAVSGTPIENKPIEFWPVLNMLDEAYWEPYSVFGHKYCGAKKTRWGWTYDGASRLKELHKRLTTTCFPYDTLVKTEVGLVKIGELVNGKQKIKVATRNQKTGEIRWRRIIAHHKRTSPSILARVVHTHGEFTATCDHLVWTQDGYKSASGLVRGDKLLTLRKREDTHDGQCQSKHSDLLLSEMCCAEQSSSRRSRQEDGYDSLGKSHSDRCNSLRVLRQGVTNGQENEKILQHVMRSQKQETDQADDSNDMHSMRQAMGSPDSQRILPSSKVLRQALCKHSSLDHEEKLWSESDFHKNLKGSERTTLRSRMADRIAGNNDNSHSSYREVPEGSKVLLNSGSSTSTLKNGGGSGRPYPQTPKTKRRGPLERGNLEESRVERVEILQRGNTQWSDGSDKESAVYDIEVEEDHNFFANGVLVHNCMIRRRKVDVLKDLPPRMHNVVPLHLRASEMKDYQLAHRDLKAWAEKNKKGSDFRAAALQRLNLLKTLIAKYKCRPIIEWVETFLESGEKLLLFCTHRALVNAVADHFKGCARVHGGVLGKKRHEEFERFNNSKSCRLLVGNHDAAGTGWSCKSASSVMIAEYPWKPGTVMQCLDRCAGIGRGIEGVPTSAYYATVAGTIEEEICEKLRSKVKILGRALDGEADSQELSVLDDVIEGLIG